MEEQARPAQALVGPKLGIRAGPDRKRAQQQVERASDGPHVGVGAEVAHAAAFAPPDHRRLGPVVVHGQRQPRVALVVLEPDVEPRLELLDQIVLEQERLGLGPDDHPLDVVGGLHHLSGAPSQVGWILEVRVHPGPERLGFPYVEDAAVPVDELVGTRHVGDRTGERTSGHVNSVPRCDQVPCHLGVGITPRGPRTAGASQAVH